MLLTKFWHLSHAYVTLFFLPLALIYAVTGIGYLCGYTGHVDSVRFSVPLTDPPPARPEAKRALIEKTLSEHGLACPVGEGRDVHNRFVIGAPTRRHVMLELPRGRNGEAVISLNKPGWFNKLMFLHKAKGNIAFNVLGVAFGVVLLFSYLSGLALVWNATAMRRPLLLCGLAGFLVALAVTIASL
jgi:hypothetical protein